MKRRGADENSSVMRFAERVYKVIAISRELMARLARVKDKSKNGVVFEKGVVKELAI